MSHDPYHDFAKELRSELENAKELARSYASIRQSKSQHSEGEVIAARDKLQDALEGLASDLEDIKQSVDVVARTPKRFGLDDVEIDGRRSFVASCERQIEELSWSMSQSAQAPSFAGATRSYSSARGDEVIDDDGEDPNEAFEREHQEQIMKQQDTTLDRIGYTLTSLRSQASAMGQEIGEQIELVGTLDSEVDSTQNRLQRAMKSMDELVRRSDDRLVAKSMNHRSYFYYF